MISITKIFEFAAAHHLPYHEGLCKNIHGHGFKLEITVTGAIQTNGSATGMIIDFKELKNIVNKVILVHLDHTDLNDIFENPTAETMAKHIADNLNLIFSTVKIVKVRLWETSTSYATWEEN